MKRAIASLLWLILAAGPVATAEAEESSRGSLTWIGDARARGDFVRDLPGDRDDLERGRLRVRAGIRWIFGPRWEADVSLRAAVATDDNRDNRRNLDNEKSNGVRPDRLAVRWFGPAGAELVLGKAPLAPELGPMVWDPDLRPVGAAYQQTFDVRGLDTLTAGVTLAHPDHDLEIGGESRIGVAQLDWRIREGAPASGAVTLSYVTFADLDRLDDSGLVRTNVPTPGLDYELVDLQLTGRRSFGDHPLEITVDTVVNLDAVRDDRDTGVELFVTFGDRRGPGRWEAGATTRRVQREAAVAAFNDDDWWFPTAMRGTRAWVARGLTDRAWARVAISTERRDDLDEALERLLVDIGFDF